MAWSTTLKTKNSIYTEGGVSYQYWESMTVAQVVSKTADYIRLAISNESEGTSLVPTGKYFKVTLGSTTIKTEKATTSGSANTLYCNVPSSWAGQTVSVSGALFTWSGVTLGAAGCFTLTVTTGENVTGTVTRSSSSSGLGDAGALSDGDFIYDGDELEISYEATTGYSASAAVNSSAVSSGGTVTVSAAVAVVFSAEPMATVHIWNGSSWDLYLVYVYSGSAWALYQFNIYSGSAWEKYY